MSEAIRGHRRRPELPFNFTVCRLNQYQRGENGKPFRLFHKGRRVNDFEVERDAIAVARTMHAELYEPELEPVVMDDEAVLARLRAHRAEAQGVR